MKGISMLKIKEILRLKFDAKLSNRKIGKALNISHSVVHDYVKQFNNSNKNYEDIISLNEIELKNLLYGNNKKEDKYPIPNWNMISTVAISKHYYRVKQVKDLFKNHKPTLFDETPSLLTLSTHKNIRGADYYA